MSEMEKAARGTTPGTASKAHSRRKFSPKSTIGAAQRDRAVVAMRLRPQSSLDLRRLGLYQAPARVKELRARGYVITTDRITLVDPDGYTHSGAALYTLVSEPDEVE